METITAETFYNYCENPLYQLVTWGPKNNDKLENDYLIAGWNFVKDEHDSYKEFLVPMDLYNIEVVYPDNYYESEDDEQYVVPDIVGFIRIGGRNFDVETLKDYARGWGEF